MAADFARLADEAQVVSNADWLHVDVMDNHFVPNLSVGLPVVRSLAAASPVPLDCHLMITDPDRWAPAYAEAGAKSVTFHVESALAPKVTARMIRQEGALAGLAISPDTALEPYLKLLPELDLLLVMTVRPGFGGQAFLPDALHKVSAARQWADAAKLPLRIGVDGGIGPDTVTLAAAAGADLFVAGTAIYGAPDPGRAVEQLRELATLGMTG